MTKNLATWKLELEPCNYDLATKTLQVTSLTSPVIDNEFEKNLKVFIWYVFES